MFDSYLFNKTGFQQSTDMLCLRIAYQSVFNAFMFYRHILIYLIYCTYMYSVKKSYIFATI